MTLTKKDVLAALDAIKGNDITMEQLEAVMQGLAAAAGKTEDVEPEPTEPPAEMADPPKEGEPPAALSAPLAAPPPAPAQVDLAPPADPMAADAAAMLVSKLQGMLPDMDPAAILAALDAKLEQVADVLRSDSASPGESATLKAQAATIRALSAKVQVLESAETERRRAREEAERVAKEEAERVALSAAQARVDALIKAHPALADERESLVVTLRERPAIFEATERALSGRPPLGRHASATDQQRRDESLAPDVDPEDPAVKVYLATFEGLRGGDGKLLSQSDKLKLARERIAALNKQAPRA